MIRVLHLADIINRDDFIHVVVEHCGPDFSLAAATLDDRGTLNRDPGAVTLLHLGAPGLLAAPLAAARLRRALKAGGIDVLHAHHYRPNLLAWAACRGLPVRWIIGRHYSDAIYQLSSGLRRRLYLRLERLCNDTADAIVAPSLAVEATLRSQGVPPSRINRIPYAFDFRRFSPVDTTGAGGEWGQHPGLRLATFARLHPEKGHRFMVPALQKLLGLGVEASWLVAGDGPGRLELQRQVREAGLATRVRFLGWRTDALPVMASADVVVQPTLHEAFSQVMVEAMALARPLVISDVSGVRDIVSDGETGLVVPPGDADALAAALAWTRDPVLRRRLGEAGRRRVHELLAVANVIPRYERLYREVVTGRSGAGA